MYVDFIKHLDMETEMGCLTKNEQFSLWKSGGKIRAFPKRGIVPDEIPTDRQTGIPPGKCNSCGALSFQDPQTRLPNRPDHAYPGSLLRLTRGNGSVDFCFQTNFPTEPSQG